MEEDRPVPLPSFAAPLCNPDPDAIRAEKWVVAEDTVREVLNCVYPTMDSEEKRKDVIEYMQNLMDYCLGVQVCPYGSVPLKTYLPDGDIDLTAVCPPNLEEFLPRDVLAVLEAAEQSQNPEFPLKSVQFIDAEVKLVKCIVQDIVIDISFNQLGGLGTLCFLEHVSNAIGKDHLFKRSVILIKAWCYYESRILGAHHGLISTYALETLVLYIFHFFHASITGPLSVLYRFLDYYSKFDWDNYCISLDGPVKKSSLPNIIVENAVNQGNDALFGGNYQKNCMEMFIAQCDGSRPFLPKHLNIIDPLRENNNLGRSVHRGNYYRILCAFKYGARKLGCVLEQPNDKVEDEIKKFFANTLKMQKEKYVPFALLSTSSPLNDVDFEDDVDLNGDLDDYMSEMDDPDLSGFRDLSLKPDNEKSDSHSKKDNKVSDSFDEKTSHDYGNFLIDETEILNQFANLNGDYNSHLRGLLHGQCCHGYAFTAAMLVTSPPVSPYGSVEWSEPWDGAVQPWDGEVQPWSVCFEPGSSSRYPNGAVTGHVVYHTNDAYGWEERRPLRGTGLYYPMVNCSMRGRRRNWGTAQANRACGGSGERSPGSEADHDDSNGPGPCERSQRKLEFGSFGPLPEGSSDAESSQRHVEYGRQQGRVGVESLHLKNDEEFPPLST